MMTLKVVLGTASLIVGLKNVNNKLVKKGFEHHFHSISVRFVVIVLFMMTIIVYTTYTSFMMAKLAVVRIPMPFTDLQGLYSERGDYRLGMLGNSSLTDILKTSSEPFLRSLWTDMLEPNPDDMVPTNEAGFARMMKLKYVFLTYAPTYAPSSDVNRLSEQYFKVPMSWPVQKRFPLLPILNFHFQRWFVSGQYSRMWKRVQLEEAPPPAGTRALGYEEMFTAFALLGTGLGLALVVTGLDLALKSKETGPRTQQSQLRPTDVEAVQKDRFGGWGK